VREGAVEDDVGLANSAGTEGSALMRPTPAVALVRHTSAVVDESAGTAAVGPAVTELRVERVEHLPADTTDRLGTEEREDVGADHALVARPGGHLDVDHREVALKQLGHGGRGPRLPVAVDVSEKTCPRLLRLGRGSKPGGHGLCDVVAPLRHRVDAGVHADP
jgi:hypothetical protein